MITGGVLVGLNIQEVNVNNQLLKPKKMKKPQRVQTIKIKEARYWCNRCMLRFNKRFNAILYLDYKKEKF